MSGAANAAQLEQLCAAAGCQGGTFEDVLAEVRRLKALEAGLRAGAGITAGMSPADVETARQAAQAFAGAQNWTAWR